MKAFGQGESRVSSKAIHNSCNKFVRFDELLLAIKADEISGSLKQFDFRCNFVIRNLE